MFNLHIKIESKVRAKLILSNLVEVSIKRCKTCKVWKLNNINYFWRCKSNNDGLNTGCNSCYINQYRAKLEQQGKFVTRERKYKVIKGHKRCYKCGDEYPATFEFFNKNKTCKDGLTTWCINCRSCFRDSRVSSIKLYNTRYRKIHKTRGKYDRQIRLDRLSKCPIDYRPSDIDFLLDMQGQKCIWCSKFITNETLTLDHFIPVSKGGFDIFDNLVLACKSCNSSKGPKLPWYFHAVNPLPLAKLKMQRYLPVVI